MRRPELWSRELVIFIGYRRHRGGNHLSLETSKTPGFSSEFDDALHGDLDTLFFFGIGEVFYGIDDLLDHSTSSCVDALLSTTASKSCEKCLLTPNGLFARALVADVVAHRQKQGVSLVVSTAQAKQEWTKDAVGDKLGDSMSHIRGAKLPVGSLLDVRQYPILQLTLKKGCPLRTRV